MSLVDLDTSVLALLKSVRFSCLANFTVDKSQSREILCIFGATPYFWMLNSKLRAIFEYDERWDTIMMECRENSIEPPRVIRFSISRFESF